MNALRFLILMMGIYRGFSLDILVAKLDVCGKTSNQSKSELETVLFGSQHDSVAQMFGYCSRRKMLITGKVVPYTIQVPCTAAPDGSLCDYDRWAEYVDKAISFQKNQTSHHVYIVPGSLCNWCGLSYMNCSTDQPCKTWISSVCASTSSVYLHELGHSIGLYHASQSDDPYGDMSDSMGYCCNRRCYNAPHAEQLGWQSPLVIYKKPWSKASYRLPLATTFIKIQLPNKWVYVQYRKSSIREQLPVNGIYIYSKPKGSTNSTLTILETTLRSNGQSTNIVDKSSGIKLRVTVAIDPAYANVTLQRMFQ
jgi:hypothetical protein